MADNRLSFTSLEVKAMYTISAAMWVAYCHMLHLKPQLSLWLFNIKVLSNICSIETTRQTVKL